MNTKVVLQRGDDGFLEFEGEEQETVLHICAEKGETLGARCYTGNCMGCLIEVLEGEKNLSDPDQKESEILKRIPRPGKIYRLACQSSLKSGKVRIKKP